MTAAINFVAMGPLAPIANLTGSGLGFYGSAGFGSSVQVGAFQGRTFITDSTGSNQGSECNNVEYVNAASGILGQTGSGILLIKIPNYQTSLKISFTNDTSVQTQNGYITAYDRVSINNPPSGVLVAAAEVIHPGLTQDNSGSGSLNWVFLSGTGTILNLSNSPGTSGLNPGHADTQHDFHTCLSTSPSSVGGKTMALYAYLEYF